MLKKDNKLSVPPPSIRHIVSKNEEVVYKPPPTSGDQQFLQLYDENIQLKKKQQELSKINQHMQDKISELKKLIDQNQNQADPLMRTAGNRQVMEMVQLKKENRELNRTVSLMRSNKAHSAVKQHAGKAIKDFEREKVDDLLRIIELNKKTIRDMEAQIKTLQRQNYLLKSQTAARESLGQKQLVEMEHEFKKERDTQNRVREKQRQLENARQKVGFLEAEIGRLQTQISTQSILQLEVQDLRTQNRRLEDNIRRLSESPIFKGVTDKVEDQTKIKSLESRCKMMEEAQQRHRQRMIALETELKLAQGQLIEATYESQQKERENSKLKEKVREHPIIDMLMQDEQTLHRVVGFLRSQDYQHNAMQLYRRQAGSSKSIIDYQSEGEARRKIQALISQKEQLAVQLHRTEGMLKALRDSYQQRERIRGIEEKLQLQQLEQREKKIKDLQVMVGHKTKAEVYSSGVRYIDSVSVFSSDDTKCEPGYNLFDLYLGSMVLVQQIVKMETNITDTSKLITFLTVDFYNHNTENSKLGTGSSYNVNSQFSFKVTEDSFFMGFLEKGYVNVEVWCSEGSKAVSLGVCKIALKSLLIKSKQNIAPVVNSSSPVYLNSKATGTLNFVMRMRFPFVDHLKEFKHLDDRQLDSKIEVGEQRKLVINISEASGMRSGCNSFVYYNLRGADYYTNTHSGGNPVWDHWNIIETNYTQDFKNYLRNGQLQLTVLDDNAPLNDTELSDVVGTSSIALTALLENNQINLSLPLKKGGSTTGQLKIKIFWYDKENSALMGLIGKPQSKQKEEQQDLQLSTNDKVLSYFKRNRLTPEQSFQKFDHNKTGVVSRSEFEAGLVNIGIRLNKQEFNAYYGQFEQPINQLNFNRVFFPEEVRTEGRVNTRQSQNNLPTQSRLPTQSQMAHSNSRHSIPQAESTEDLHRQLSTNHPPADRPIVQSMKEINKFIKKNTVDLKRMTLREFLKGRQNELLTIALDIDKNNDGTISKAELQSYLDAHGVDAVIEDERVNLMDFLKKYSSKEQNTVADGVAASGPPIRRAMSIHGGTSQVPRRSSKK